MKFALNLAALLVLGTGLAGCDIGEGNTVEELAIVPASDASQLKNFEVGDRYKLVQCFRDELLVRATFTDGTQANFSGRASWTSSDPSVVQVSDGDIAAVLLAGNPAGDGTFFESDTVKYARGTVIPVGTPGQTAVITVRFASLSASIEVEIRKPTLKIVAVPEPDPNAAVPPYYLAERTSQRLAVLADVDGRAVRGAELSPGVSNGFNNGVLSINPFRWIFTGGTFVPEDPDVGDDFDEWVIDAGADRIAVLRPFSSDGVVEGVTADFTPHEVAAELSLCPGIDPALRPLASVQVATLYDDPGTPADDRLVLTREAGFHGSGFAIEDQVTGSSQALQLRGRLDANGDGSLIVEQNFDSVGRYLVQPLNAGCTDADALLGCGSNADFQVTGALLRAGASAAEGDTGRVHACFPLCLQPLATLEADSTSVGTGVAVNFTALAVNPIAGVTANYLFDFGDGTTQGPQAGATASHTYATDGAFTATVRLVDPAFPDEFLSANAGAVRVLAGVAPTAGNTAPTATLTVNSFPNAGLVTTTLSAASSDDDDSGDSITVYEFDPGDGTPIIRQSSAVMSHTYLDGTNSPFTPTVRVYDESGVASTVVSGSDVTVTSVAPAFTRSNRLDLRARKASLCAVELQPVPAAVPTEAAFTFPGLRFQAMGSFVADTDADACTDLEIGKQLITRFMVWTVRPGGVDSEISDIVRIRENTNDYQFPGQVIYESDVAVDTLVDISAVPFAPFDVEDLEATPTTLTVTPCTTCTP